MLNLTDSGKQLDFFNKLKYKFIDEERVKYSVVGVAKMLLPLKLLFGVKIYCEAYLGP